MASSFLFQQSLFAQARGKGRKLPDGSFHLQRQLLTGKSFNKPPSLLSRISFTPVAS
jgi:hypothetical protein